MKTVIIAALAFMAIIWVSCKKNDVTVTATQISGTWNIVSDSTYSSGIGPNGLPSSHKYIGVIGDYFTFNANKLYIKEGTIKLDTATYTIAGDTLKLNYTYRNDGGVIVKGSVGAYIINIINQESMELSSFGITPAGIFNEYIMLNR